MKRFVTILAALALIACMSVPAFANDGTVTMYTTTTVNAYALASTSSQVLATFPAGTSVITYPNEDLNGFKHCFTNQTQFCYIPSAYLTTNPGGSVGPTPSPASNEKVVSGVTNYLALRNEPATRESNEIGKLYNGETFYVSSYTNGFAYGRTSWGKYGYVNANYLATPGSSSGPGTTGGTTVYNGTDWSAVYNYDYYVSHNPDVVAALGTSPSAVISHFVNNGIHEGRQGRADWNVWTYIQQHPDLYNIYGNDYAAYYKIAVGLRP